MANTQNPRLGRMSLLGATLIWGSSFIILKSTLNSVSYTHLTLPTILRV